jgi:hypothetical protein
LTLQVLFYMLSVMQFIIYEQKFYILRGKNVFSY